MADSPDSPFTPYDDQLRQSTALPQGWAASVPRPKWPERDLGNFRRRQRQEIARGFKDQGKTWKEIGEIMGGVTYQRAHQFGRGE